MLRGRHKMAGILQTFRLSWTTIIVFFIQIKLQYGKRQYIRIELDNGLAPNRLSVSIDVVDTRFYLVETGSNCFNHSMLHCSGNGRMGVWPPFLHNTWCWLLTFTLLWVKYLSSTLPEIDPDTAYVVCISVSLGFHYMVSVFPRFL